MIKNRHDKRLYLKITTIRSIEHTAFVGRDHVFDIDEGILTSCLLEELQCLHDEVSEVESLTLVILNFVARVFVAVSEDIEDG